MIDDSATTGDDGTVPDTAMMTGSEAGDPGDRSTSLPLDDSERALLASLVSGAPVSVEASPETLRAASDDTALPQGRREQPDDPFTPTFREP